MTQQELLADMMRRYPIGSVVECLADNRKYVIQSFEHPTQNEDEFWCNGVDKYGHELGVLLKSGDNYAQISPTQT